MLEHATIAHSSEFDGPEKPPFVGWYLCRTSEPEGGEFDLVAGPFETDTAAIDEAAARGIELDGLEVAA
jgi:hypothetical protein